MSWKYSISISLLICLLAYLAAGVIVYALTPFLLNHNPLLNALKADVIATLVIFLFSVAFRNASLYDPYWSVIPPCIVYFWIVQTENFSTLNLMILTVVLFWSIRLTFNWIRGWKGLTHEDWRYVQLRENNPRIYQLINLLGIHLFPTVIVFLSLIPFYFAVTTAQSISPFHIMGLLISLSGFLLQLVSDEQLNTWRKKEAGEKCIETGLWKFSRHPNYLGEIVFWWGGWFLAIGTSTEYYWTGIGPILLTGMFIFISIPMIEKRHLKRRPCYIETIRKVPMLFGLKTSNK